MFALIKRLWDSLTKLADESAGLAEDFAIMRRGLRSAGALPNDDATLALPAPEAGTNKRRK
jgi:hypothetical protein